MTRFLRRFTPFFILSILFSAQTVSAQEIELSKLQNHLVDRQEEWGLTTQDIQSLRIVQVVKTAHNGVQHVYLNQQINGIDVDGGTINMHVRPNDEIFTIGHRLISNVSSKVAPQSPRLSVEDGLAKTAGELELKSRSIPTLRSKGEAERYHFEGGAMSMSAIEGHLKYVENDNDGYVLVWSYVIHGAGDLWNVQIDARSGELFAKTRMSINCQFEDGYLAHPNPDAAPCALHPEHSQGFSSSSTLEGGQYKVIPFPTESPSHGTRSMVSSAEHPEASPFGWHDTNGIMGAEFTKTRGNNVFAYIDRDWDDGEDNGAVVDGGAELIFDFEVDFDQEPIAYQEAAATNLFYVNNVMHDISQRYGFDEAAGNFQSNNYSQTGVETDFVFAMAQRGANDPIECGNDTQPDGNGGSTPCINNANFGTPGDGSNPSMRMFLWTTITGNQFLRVDEPIQIAQTIETTIAANDWSVPINSTPVTGQVVIADDGTGQSTLACSEVQNDLTGKIAMIDRGVCDFSLKVLNAQNAGAIGAIICNFEDALLLGTLGGGDGAAEVTIPVVFIKSSDCTVLRNAVETGLVVSLVTPPGTGGGPERVDGDFDNGIIAHEYTHGISNRLTGGAFSSGCLSDNESRGMGEGWSDFLALATTVRIGDTGDLARGIGTYAQRQETTGRGIRPFPYTTNMAVNPHVYEDVAFESIPHGVGSVWCAMLWDMYWAFVDEYGFDPDIYDGTGGNNMAIQLVIDGLKIQPCDPGFVEARDAILMADQMNNAGANQALIWNAFARRGLGFGADQGTTTSVVDGAMSFKTCPSCTNALTVEKEMSDFIEGGDEILVTLNIGNYKDADLTGVVATDAIPAGATVITASGSMPFEVVGNDVVFDIGNMASQEEMTITYRLQSDNDQFSTSLFLDDMEDGDLNWDIDFDPSLNLLIWEVLPGIMSNSGENAWVISDPETEGDHWFQSREPFLVESDRTALRFFHNYNTEPRADAGFLSVSTDGGITWNFVADDFILNGYPGRMQYTTFAIPNLQSFWGQSPAGFTMSVLDLSKYQGEEILVRFRFGSDNNTSGLGWFIDDIEFLELLNYNSEVCVSANEGDSDCTTAPGKGTIVETGISVSAEELTEEEVRFSAFPNPANDQLTISLASEQFQSAELTLINATGQQFMNRQVAMSSSTQNVNFDVRNIPEGMYFVRLKTNQKQKVIKVVIQ